MVEIPSDKLLDRNEVAALLQISKSALEKGYFDCLVEIRHGGKILFNPHQVLAHRNILWAGEDCKGRCREALKPKVEGEKQRSFRRKKQKEG
jgi:hypothetical protein